MKDHAVIGGKIPDMNLYDAADVAPTGEAFPHTGRRAHSVTTVKDVKQELDDMEEEDAEETCKRKTDFYNGMIKSGKVATGQRIRGRDQTGMRPQPLSK